MSKNRVECTVCAGSFRSEKAYSIHECKSVNSTSQIKKEPKEENDISEDPNIVVKIESSDLFETPEEVDPLSFTTVKEEIETYDEPCLNIKTESDLIICENTESAKSDEEELTANAASFLSSNTYLNCKSCGKTFQSHRTFNRHVVSAHKTFKPYSCNVCGKKFLQKHYVTLHMRVHTGERPYVCPLCPKKYTHKTSFTIHMRIHKGERPYECAICGKRCYDKSGLTSHIRSHTKETPYKCEVCDRRFTHSKSLLVHRRNHTGEKPYICSYCGKAFRHWHKHKIHVRLHTGERPYTCKVCGKGFPRNDEVKRHMRSHTGIKSFRCSICGAYCATQSSITGHINIHHSNLKNGEVVPEKTQVTDGITGVLGSKVPEPRSIYKNIAQQSSYVAKILMTAQNIKEKKVTLPSTKVIEITTKETIPTRTIRPKLRPQRSLGFSVSNSVNPSSSVISNKLIDYKDFKIWQAKMLEKQGLVVQGLPADDDKEKEPCVKNFDNQSRQPNTEAGKQQFILLSQQGSSASSSKLLVPINTTKITKSPIDVPSPSLGVSCAPNKPYLLVPESVATQPMFLLSSGPQKMILMSAAATRTGRVPLQFDPAVQQSSIKEITSHSSETVSDLNVKIEQED